MKTWLLPGTATASRCALTPWHRKAGPEEPVRRAVLVFLRPDAEVVFDDMEALMAQERAGGCDYSQGLT